MKASIETISGKEMTVIWHHKDYQNHPIEALICDDCIIDISLVSGGVVYVDYDTDEHIATALPALPRFPSKDNALLFWRYMSEGFQIRLKSKYNKDGWVFLSEADIDHGLTEIDYVMDRNLNTIEVAINNER